MLEIKNGKIFVNGKETQDHELIALAVKDIAEENPKAAIIIADDKKLVSIIESYTELVQISEFAKEQMKENEISLCRFNIPFKHNSYSTSILYNLLMMIKMGSLVVKTTYNQDYADKQREADEIVNDIEDNF